MINIENIAPHAHQITVMAEFRQADVEPIVAFAKERNAGEGGGNLLIDLTSMAGFSWSAVGEELGHMPMLMKCIYGFDRIAIISDEQWIRTVARIESALLPGVVYQVYAEDEAEAAKAWIVEEADDPRTGAFEELNINNPAIAAFALSGRLSAKEAEHGVDLVRYRLDNGECSRMMMVIKNWHGFDADAMFNEHVMSAKLALINKLDRYAIVGGPAWIRGMAGAMGALIKPEIRTYELDEQEAAIAWLSE